jgi:hypothetical protein
MSCCSALLRFLLLFWMTRSSALIELLQPMLAYTVLENQYTEQLDNTRTRRLKVQSRIPRTQCTKRLDDAQKGQERLGFCHRRS